MTLCVLLAALLWIGARHSRRVERPSAAPPSSESAALPASSPGGQPPLPVSSAPKATASRPADSFPWLRSHPFPAGRTNGGYAWTMEDGKDTNIIRQLAHNGLEYARMVNENATIYRRQLVYHSEAFTLDAQRAVRSGQSVGQVVLPGFDGQELPVTVTRTDLESGGDRGIFYGKLPGRPDSLVTVAFIGAREAFTVVSPQDKLYLSAESREPGEMVVKSVNPAAYAAAPCGNP